eukprot:1182621-Prorocentrum_minimum.AAC.4
MVTAWDAIGWGGPADSGSVGGGIRNAAEHVRQWVSVPGADRPRDPPPELSDPPTPLDPL